MFGFHFDPLLIAINIPVFLISLSFHELLHGYTAYKFGDSTAKYDGRLSLNPFRHIDPIGFILMIVWQFGWAKPVMVNIRNLKNPKKDMALIALFGPVANIILAFASLLIYHPLAYLFKGNVPDLLSLFFSQLFFINLSLALFNLIPLPPLDGSKIMSSFIPLKYYFRYMEIERYGFIILIILILTGVVGKILGPLMFGKYGVYAGMSFLVDKIYFFLN